MEFIKIFLTLLLPIDYIIAFLSIFYSLDYVTILKINIYFSSYFNDSASFI